jgi:hypothetical protein
VELKYSVKPNDAVGRRFGIETGRIASTTESARRARINRAAMWRLAGDRKDAPSNLPDMSYPHRSISNDRLQ